MKRIIKAIGRGIRSGLTGTAQAAYVSLRPFRTNRRLLVIQSNNHDLNAHNEDLQEEIESLNRKVKFLKRDLNNSHKETAKANKDVAALRRFVVTVNRIEIPRRKGAIDELITSRHEIHDTEEG